MRCRCKWGDIITLEYGKPVPDKERTDGQYPVYGTNGQIGTSELPPLCNHPSFILGRKGAYRGVHYSNLPFSVIDTAFYAENKTEAVDLLWAYYKFLTYDINRMDSGSAIPSTDRYEIYSIELELPTLPKQHTIAATLYCLDNKIKLNNKINVNLEAQAQAIFKSWFVDFEPFQDGEFVESELGRIPKGWTVGKVKDVADLNNESYSSKCNWKYINYLDTSSITDNRVDCYQLLHKGVDKIPSRAKRIIQNGDIVYSTVRPNQKHFGLINNPPQNAVASTGFAVIRSCSSIVCTEQIYLALTTNEAVERLQQIAETATSTFPACKPKDIGDLPIIIPDKAIGEAFASYIKSVFKCIDTRNVQSHTLSSLRDTLLPKLMSGEISVTEI